jgi:thiamine transport system permease protein
MARGHGALIPALPALCLIGLVVGGAVIGLAAVPLAWPERPWADPYLRHILWFTLAQAGLSTLVSLAAAVPVARALARRQFTGRTALLRLFGLPMIVPALAGAFGMLAVFGRSGLVGDGLAALGSDARVDVYGLSGIVLTHAFFNMPFAVRVLVGAWGAVPSESWRLAAMLGMRGGAVFRLIEWPLLARHLPGLFVLIFLLCASSFAIVLTLGGGPGATTLEVAIYQAIRVDFDVGRAVFLSLLQIALCASLSLAAGRLTGHQAVGATLGRPVRRFDSRGRAARTIDAAAIALAALFVLLPLAAIVANGLPGLAGPVATGAGVRAAALRSLAIALAAGTLALAAGWGLTWAVVRLRVRGRPGLARLLDLLGTVVLIVPPIVLGAGLFLLFRGTAAPGYGAVAIVLVNALMALPFVLGILRPAAEEAEARYGRLCAGLGVAGLHRLRLVDWPVLRRPAALALAFAAALSFGDLGVVTLVGQDGAETLPLVLSRLLGSYRLRDAAGVVLLLLVMGLALFLLLERWIGGRERH